MRLYFLLTSFLLFTAFSIAQVGIGTTTPATGSLLHVDDGNGNKGILIPKVAIEDLSTAAPLDTNLEVGTLVFNSSGSNPIGFYYWAGPTNGWSRMADAGGDTSIYTNDGTLTSDREISAGTNSLQLNSDGSKNSFTIRRTANGNPLGIAFRNSGNAYDASIFMESQTSSGLVFATRGNSTDINTLGETLILQDNGQLTLPKYIATDTDFDAVPVSFLGVDNNGNIIKNDAANSLSNIYNSDGTLSGDRTIQMNGNELSFANSANRDFKIIPAATADAPGLLATDAPFQFTTNNSFDFVVDNVSGLWVKSDREITLGQYGANTFLDNSTANRLLTVSPDGSLNVANQSILNQNIYVTDGTLTGNRVLNTGNFTLTIENDAAADAASQNDPLVIRESFSNPGDSNGGSLTFEHGSGQASSIVFKSGFNPNSDAAIIRYEDDGSGNGSTNENSLLTIRTENDASGIYQDDINIDSAGSLGINNNAPHPSSSIDMGRNNKGLLINRVSLTSLDTAAPIANPANGLLVFNTNTNFNPAGYLNDVRPGFYYWDGTNNRWVAQTPETRSARWTSTNTSLNLNSNTNIEAPLIEFQQWNDDTTLYNATVSSTASRVTIQEDGVFQIIANIPIESNSIRTNIDAEVVLNRGGTLFYPGGVSAANYIRETDGHNHSTIMINEVIRVQRGDQLYISLNREANSGTVEIRSNGAANLTITKLK